MHSGGFRPAPDFAGAGSGLWDVSAQVGDSMVPARYHGGSMLGFHSLMMVEPSARLGIFVSANRDAEAGGGPVRFDRKIVSTLISHFTEVDAVARDDIPFEPKSDDYSEYAGNYALPLYCKSCSEEEIERGAWRRRGSISVTTANDGLLLDSDSPYHPAIDRRDIFVHRGGKRAIVFVRDGEGRVVAFSYRDEPYAYERVN